MPIKDKFKAKKRHWERKHKGETYPGPFTTEMRSNLHIKRLSTNEARKIWREKHRTIADMDCPTIVLGSRTWQVIIGSILGDGHVSTKNKLSETHCLQQKEIISEMYRLLEPWYKFRDNLYPDKSQLKRNLTTESRYHKKTYGKVVLQYHISTPAFPVFRQLRQLWYPEGKKMVPNEILDKIDLQALAWWYLGDGTYTIGRKQLHFCTDGFTSEDNEKLSKVLLRFGLSSSRVTRRNHIRLGREDTAKFLPLISEYIMPSMRYKLGPLEHTYKPYNPRHYDPEPIITERMLRELNNPCSATQPSL